MTQLHFAKRAQDTKSPAFLRGFAREEDGVMTVLACFVILMMLLVGGIGVDLMRNEMERVRIQNISDRAVLAAADLDQENDPSLVVQDYFEKSTPNAVVNSVTITEGLNFRTVRVDADTTTPTRFMRMVGVDELPVPGSSAAEERVNKVEISLVVDISGSMKNDSKITNLRTAAKTFVDTVITDDTKDLISISLVPYSEHVNPGKEIASRMNVNYVHDYGASPDWGDINCLEFPDNQFNSTVINLGMTYDQMQHYQWNSYSNSTGNTQNTRHDTVCPRYEYETITPFSQDAGALKAQIDQLQPRAGTSIFLGMKWGAGMLDPAFRPLNSELSTGGVVDGVFSTRPASFDDSETLKTVILMTDGQNDNSNRIVDSVYSTRSHARHWNDYNFNYYLSRYVSYSQRQYWSYKKYNAAQGDQLLHNVCESAKQSHIVIWSIGFEVNDHGANVMKSCASSPSHFFRVEGIELTEAFKAIARQINQLRLTQ